MSTFRTSAISLVQLDKEDQHGEEFVGSSSGARLVIFGLRLLVGPHSTTTKFV